MLTGTVTSYDKRKGYGYIDPDGEGRGVFVSFREVVRAGLGPLSEGQRLRFRLEPDQRSRIAVDLAAITR